MQVSPTQSITSNAYISAISAGLRPYIEHIKDVIADGNCGFRAVSDMIGMSEDGWIQVGQNLLNELQSHLEYYIQLYRICGRVNELIHALSQRST